ncbi:MAG: ATP-binding protein [Deltaproteobacteria bacterium]|nr:ATP-binding protein [Deltaproteobacteria bacterium]
MQNQPTHHENILESLPDAVIFVDRKMRVEVFTQSAERILEVSRGRVIWKNADEALSLNEWIVKLVKRSLDEGMRFYSHEGLVTRRISKPLAVKVSTAPVTDQSGALSGVVCFIRESGGVTPIEAESRRKEDLEKIEAFAMHVAHEIKNPLGGIRGAAQMLTKRLKEKKHLELASIITESSDRLSAILDDMLGLSGKPRGGKKAVNVHKAIDNAIKSFESGADAPLFIRNYDPSLPPVLGNEGRLTQVFVNVIKNACEAVARRNGEVTISSRMVTEFHVIESGSKEEKFVEIAVTDNGKGIPKEDLEKVLMPFYTTKKGGSGMGLGLSYRIIKEHGGFFRIEPSPIGGTSVKIYLPLETVK